MVQINRVVIVGRGAVGAIYADAFARTKNIELRVAVDRARCERYSTEQFVFNGHSLDLEYFTPQQGDLIADIIIIATKWDGYADALDLIEPIVGRSTIVLPLLNGLLPYEIAEEKFGMQRAMRGYYIGHTATREGRDVHQDGAYRTVVGEKINEQNQLSDRLASVIDLFDRAGVKYRVDEDMEWSRWLKFAINLGLNQTSALDGGLSYGQIRSSNYYSDLCVGLMAECVVVAQRCGVANSGSMIERARNLLDTLPDEDYSSMAQDVRAGRATEWPIFGGYLLQVADKLGLDLPLHKAIDLEINK